MRSVMFFLILIILGINPLQTLRCSDDQWEILVNIEKEERGCCCWKTKKENKEHFLTKDFQQYQDDDLLNSTPQTSLQKSGTTNTIGFWCCETKEFLKEGETENCCQSGMRKFCDKTSHPCVPVIFSGILVGGVALTVLLLNYLGG